MSSERASRDEILAALDRIRVLNDRIRENGEATFEAEEPDSEILQLAACHLVIRLQAVLDDLPADLTNSDPALPFRAVRGMRNRLAHGYADIDVALLWETVDGALPSFLDVLLERIRAADW